MNSTEKDIYLREKFGGVPVNFDNKKLFNDGLVIFDFDETLVKSKHVFQQVNKAVMQYLDLECNDFIASNIFALHDKEYFGWGKDLNEQIDIYNKYFNPLVTQFSNIPYFYKQMEFYKEMKNVIIELSKTDINMAIASSRDLNSILTFLQMEGVKNCFKMIEATEGGKNFEDKPSTHIVDYISAELGISLSNAVMVGDTSSDIKMGKSAGMKTLAIGYGRFQNAESLREYQPDALLSNENQVKQIPSILKGLLASTKQK